MKLIHSVTLCLFCMLILSSACENDSNPGEKEQSDEVVVNTPESVSLEELVIKIDGEQDSLNSIQSLYYSKEDGTSVTVEAFLNDSNEVVKIVEKYTLPDFASILTNLFYLEKGKKFVSKEFFEEKTVHGTQFVERVSFYDANEKPLYTKRRVAQYEEMLDQESFKKTTSRDCSMERAVNVINQRGEFETTFQGVVRSQGSIYLIVGENKKDGFASSLLVQAYTPELTALIENEKENIGTPLEVYFETASSSEQFEYQRLLGLKILDK